MSGQSNLPNLYASPSLLITARSASSPSVIQAISRNRILVESDTSDVRLSTQLVWGAVEWIGRCKGWQVEGLNGEDAEPWCLNEKGEDEKGVNRTVRILERNWMRFMRITDRQ